MADCWIDGLVSSLHEVRSTDPAARDGLWKDDAMPAQCLSAPDALRLRTSKGVYVIRLKNCSFYANHGVFDEEKALGQRFHVDVELRVNALQGLENDDIGSTIDYGAVFALIEQIVSGQRRFLIETLALDIAKALCRRFDQVESANVAIRKPNVPIRGVLDHVEVEVCWPLA